VAAYEESEREANQRLVEKYQEKVWSNWRRLIKAMLIREKLKLKYDAKMVENVISKANKKKYESMADDVNEQFADRVIAAAFSATSSKFSKQTTKKSRVTKTKAAKDDDYTESNPSQSSGEDSDYQIKARSKPKRLKATKSSTKKIAKEDKKLSEDEEPKNSKIFVSKTIEFRSDELKLSESEDD
jgi:hypothetical protein